MDTFDTQCKNCDAVLAAPVTYVGKSVKCTSCATEFIADPIMASTSEPPLPTKPSANPQPASNVNQSEGNVDTELSKLRLSDLPWYVKSAVSLGALSIIFNFSFTGNWEYRIEAPADTKFEEEMDQLGKAGWELVSSRRAVSGGEAGYECIFKRKTTVLNMIKGIFD